MKHKLTLLSQAVQVLIAQYVEEMRKFLSRREAAEWHKRMGKTTMYANYRFQQMMLDLACLSVPPRPIQYWIEQLYPKPSVAVKFNNRGAAVIELPPDLPEGSYAFTWRTGEPKVYYQLANRMGEK